MTGFFIACLVLSEPEKGASIRSPFRLRLGCWPPSGSGGVTSLISPIRLKVQISLMLESAMPSPLKALAAHRTQGSNHSNGKEEWSATAERLTAVFDVVAVCRFRLVYPRQYGERSPVLSKAAHHHWAFTASAECPLFRLPLLTERTLPDAPRVRAKHFPHL